MGARTNLAAVAAVLWLSLAAADGLAEDRHAGYYYPPPTSEETYQARARTLPEANRSLRLGFVTGVATELQQRPREPRRRS
jgi:hypothetical protein